MRRSKSKKLIVSGKNNRPKGIVRIIGGEMRGRKLYFNDSEGLRPTLDRIRETVFNWLARDIVQSRCLDLFAGSGALGFEAYSRGADSVTMVEKSAQVCRDLKANCEAIKAEKITVVGQSAEQFLTETNQTYDLVFLDPPFGQELLVKTLPLLPAVLSPGALIYIEQEISNTPFIPDENWLQLKFKSTSSFSYALYQLK